MTFATIIAAGKDIDPARSIHWLFPAQAELIYGTISSLIIFGLLWKFAGPAINKAMAARTDRIQTELDESAQAKTAAEAEATGIRQAAGDIEAERARLFALADEQAESLLAEGRERLEVEVADMQARADADIAAAASRGTDELRFEISRLASQATDRVLAGGAVDADTQQALVESFIAKVGQS